MITKQFKSSMAFTLVEAMIAIVILAIAALGAMSYQYLATGHARTARAEITATRTAQLLLEDWKSTGGSANYDPTTLELGFTKPQNDYFIVVDNLPMYITLSYDDIEYDAVAGITLRETTVRIEWRRDHTQGSRDADDPSLVLTTYVRVDASGG